MSRVGKKEVLLPKNVKVSIKNDLIELSGPLGTMQVICPPIIKVTHEASLLKVEVNKSSDFRYAGDVSALWGSIRANLNNCAIGVSQGFNKDLELNGVGYKAALTGNTLQLSLGYSHQIDFPLPKAIVSKVTKNVIELSSYNKELLGKIASEIRALRGPEPYKGKGIKYVTETIRRKAGKSGAKK